MTPKQATEAKSKMAQGIGAMVVGAVILIISWALMHSADNHNVTCQMQGYTGQSTAGCNVTSGGLFILFRIALYAGIIIAVSGLAFVLHAYQEMQNNMTLDSDIAANPRNPALYIRRAKRAVGLQQYTEALADYNTAVKLAPSAHYYNVRGNFFYARKAYDKAATDYRKAIELEPHVVVYRNNLAKAEARQRGEAAT